MTSCRQATLTFLTTSSPMPARFWLALVLSALAGIAVLVAKPIGRKPKSFMPWRGQIKPPPPWPWLAAYASPDRTAHTAACVRSLTASFRRRFWTCSFTVSTLMWSDRAISSLDSPKAT